LVILLGNYNYACPPTPRNPTRMQAFMRYIIVFELITTQSRISTSTWSTTRGYGRLQSKTSL